MVMGLIHRLTDALADQSKEKLKGTVDADANKIENYAEG